MAEETTTPVEPQIPQAEIESGKTMAILSYIPIAALGLIISIICVAQKNNAFSLYHAKQALTLYICSLAASFVLALTCIGAFLIWGVGVAALVFCVLGIINANNGQCKPLPLLDPVAQKLFGKIQKT